MIAPNYSKNNSREAYSSYSYSSARSHLSERRPHISYAELITMAIESSEHSQLTLKGIYTWISTHYPYFDSHKSGWQNSIRHNLSLNRCFYKVPRAEGQRGKGSYWKINYEYQNSKINYRTKKYTSTNETMADASIRSLNDILNENTNHIFDRIGMNELPYKQTTVFNGNLMDGEYVVPGEYCCMSEYTNSPDEKNKTDHIFSFK
ncbi:hypothetical protein ENBRE01_3179 [Enteropsectra breve]|nr:hypothetical protein ENBRE01_3179 [Enteropsectra breve]